MPTFETLFKKLKSWMQPWRSGLEPIEIRKAIFDEVDAAVVAAGAGKRIFPFNRLTIHLLAENAQEQAVLEAVVDEAWDLGREIPEHLRSAGVLFSPDLAIEVEYHDQRTGDFDEGRFYIEWERSEATTPEAFYPELELTVTKGAAEQEVYNFRKDRIFIGRLPEVLDRHGRVKRRNDVVFLEEGEGNETVSREHARILFDAREATFRIRDDQSAYGTRILRHGEPIDVSSRDRRGVRLQSGDEVYLGQACLGIKI